MGGGIPCPLRVKGFSSFEKSLTGVSYALAAPPDMKKKPLVLSEIQLQIPCFVSPLLEVNLRPLRFPQDPNPFSKVLNRYVREIKQRQGGVNS